MPRPPGAELGRAQDRGLRQAARLRSTTRIPPLCMAPPWPMDRPYVKSCGTPISRSGLRLLRSLRSRGLGAPRAGGSGRVLEGGAHEGVDLASGHGAGDEVALTAGAAHLTQQFQLLRALDALGDDDEAEVVAEPYDRPGQQGDGLVAAQPGDERRIDL